MISIIKLIIIKKLADYMLKPTAYSHIYRLKNHVFL